MFASSRAQARRFLGQFEFSQIYTLVATAVCLAIASCIAFIPQYEGLSDAGRRALFIMLFSAGMWVSEAIPAFATSLLAIGLMIALLGRPDGVFAHSSKDWQMFIRPWGSPLIWLFFGGFCMAAAAEKTGLDRWLAARTLGLFGQRPAMVLMGVMLVTAILSMFMSNTATATLVLAMMMPVFASHPQGSPLPKTLALGIAFAANLGGMGTIIGTPPNAIAAGLLSDSNPVNFAEWMLIAVPPSLILLAISWVYLVVVYLRKEAFQLSEGILFYEKAAADPKPLIKQIVTIGVFAVTVGLWVTSPLHGLPTTLVSILPITALTATGILTSEDIQRLPWDILLLITGGLSLGIAMDKTGLASWTVDQLPLESWSLVLMVIGFGYVTIFMANLMSHTASANLVLPIAIAVLTATPDADVRFAVPIALAASAAMCLPISTPPNAIVYSSGHLKTTDLIGGGLLIGLIAPPLVVAWAWLAMSWL